MRIISCVFSCMIVALVLASGGSESGSETQTVDDDPLRCDANSLPSSDITISSSLSSSTSSDSSISPTDSSISSSDSSSETSSPTSSSSSSSSSEGSPSLKDSASSSSAETTSTPSESPSISPLSESAKLSRFVAFTHQALRNSMRANSSHHLFQVDLHIALMYGGIGAILWELHPDIPMPRRPEERELRLSVQTNDTLATREAWTPVIERLLTEMESAVRNLDSALAQTYLLNVGVFELAQSRGNLKRYLLETLDHLEEDKAVQEFLKLVRESSSPLQWSEFIPLVMTSNITSPELLLPGTMTPWIREEGISVDMDGFITAKGDSRGRPPVVGGDIVVSFFNDLTTPVQVKWRDDEVAELDGGKQVTFVTVWRDHWEFKGANTSRTLIVQDKARRYQVYSASGHRYYDEGFAYYSYANMWPRRPVRFPSHSKDTVVKHEMPWTSPEGATHNEMEITLKSSRDLTIFEISNVVSEAEMDFVKEYCASHTKGRSETEGGRSSECFVSNVESPVFSNITGRLYTALGISFDEGCDQCETPFLNVYPEGSFGPVRGHAQVPFTAPNHSHTDFGSNRYVTVLIWYSDAVGGALTFPRVLVDGKPLRFEPKKGSAIAWYNLYPDGNLNPHAITSHEPVTSGEMWLGALSCWDFVLGETHSWNNRNKNMTFSVPFVVQVAREELQ